MSNRNQLIQLIHVAKRELGLDDDVYRLLLESNTAKTSCKSMSIKELESVLSTLENKGFKRKASSNKKSFKRRLSAKSGKVKTDVNKITAIWITMAKQGFVRDGSASALDAYVRRMTHRNSGEGVDHVAWCSTNQAYQVLEALKSWHRRVMIDYMDEKGEPIPMSERTGKPAAYDEISCVYMTMPKHNENIQ